MHRSLMSMQGMPVTSEQGLRLGAVMDAYFDPFEQRIIALVIDWENDMVRGPEDLLPITQISQLNADILTVPHEMGVTAGLEYEFQIETEGLLLVVEQMVGRMAALASGEAIGSLADMQFDPQDGSVEAYELNPLGEQERDQPALLIPPHPHYEFRDDVIVVPDELKNRLQRRERQEPPPGITMIDRELGEEELVGEDDVEVYRDSSQRPF